VNDFRKILGMEAYTPVDNVAELTARTNDYGWHTVFEDWLVTSRLTKKDTVLIFSVGGGGSLSPNIVDALKYTQNVGATIIGIVSKDGGYTAKVADCCIIIPTIDTDTITPHAEEFQVILWHLIVNHPRFGIDQKLAVFFDRDGVLCQDSSPNPEDLIISPDTVDLTKLKTLGFLLLVVTNQAGVPRGYQTKENVQKVNRLLLEVLPLDDILVCYHDTDTGCFCRKPRPGMLLWAAHQYSIDLSRSFMVGDRLTDVEAGQRAGCTSILIDKTMTLSRGITYIMEKYENTLGS
jgi:histidinol-phosphate phosphatase family protein